MEIVFIATILEMVLVILLLAIVFVAGHSFISRQTGRFNKRSALMRVEAHAVILHIEQTGRFSRQQAQVKLQMQVYPDRGRNFVAECKELFSAYDLAMLQNGCMVRVSYNPSNIKEVVLVKTA